MPFMWECDCCCDHDGDWTPGPPLTGEQSERMVAMASEMGKVFGMRIDSIVLDIVKGE